MRLLCILLFAPFVAFAQPTDNSKSVLYGERGGLPDLPDTYRLFLDRNGDLYPDLTIPDSMLSAADASLAQLYVQRPGLFPSALPSFAAYQDSVLESTISALKALSASVQDVFVLVHGFRKPFHPTPGGRTAQSEYLFVQQRIRNTTPGAIRSLFVEVYWDGTYDCCFSMKTKRNREIFELFELQAQQHASAAGYRLRPLLVSIPTKRLHLIGHSLGTRVLLAATFNAYPEDVPERLQQLATPTQPLVDICLIGPAVAGDVFERYYERGTADVPTKDNYQLAIFYNRKDFVLKKRIFIFGPGPRRFGDTSLGADRRRSIKKLTKRFAADYPTSQVASFRVDIGISHALRHYTGTAEFTDYLKDLWQGQVRIPHEPHP